MVGYIARAGEAAWLDGEPGIFVGRERQIGADWLRSIFAVKLD